RRTPRVAARHRLDRGVAADRQLRGDLDRLRAWPAEVADLAVPGGQHPQLRVQDAVRHRPDPAAVPDAAGDHRLPRRRARARVAGTGRSLSGAGRWPQPRSAITTCAALWPGAPVTPPPGWVPEPHRYRPGIAPR